MSGLTSLPTRTAGSLGTMKFDAEPIAEDKVDQHILAAEHNAAMEALEGVCEEMGTHDDPAPDTVLWRLPLVERMIVGAGYTWESYAATGDLAPHAYWRIAPAAPATMTLPALPSGSEVHVRHLAIEASAYAVTLARHGGTGTINGSAASLTISARSETTLYSVVSTSSGHVVKMVGQRVVSPTYTPSLRPSSSSLYLFDGSLNDSGPAGRNLTALVGTIRYVPLRTGARRFAQVASGAVCFAQASNAWVDAVYPVTIEGVVNTTLCNGLTSSGGVIASLSNAAAPSGTVWAMRVMNDYTVSLYYYDATSTLRELVSTNYVPSVGDCVIHGVISVSGGDTTLTIYINGFASGTTTFAGTVPRAVANQRASIMGWLDGGGQWGQTHPRPFYACHLMLEALDAATCLARSREILGVSV